MLNKLIGHKVVIELDNGNIRVNGKLTMEDGVYYVDEVEFTQNEVVSIKGKTIKLLSFPIIKPSDAAGERAILVNEYASFNGRISEDGRQFVSDDKAVVADLRAWHCVCYRDCLQGVVIVEVV